MKKFALFRPLDPRLAADLKKQRSSILKGLLCVLATSLLTAATIPLINLSVTAIQEAAPLQATLKEREDQQKKELEARAEKIGAKLGADPVRVADALRPVGSQASEATLEAETTALVRVLNADREQVREALLGAGVSPSGNFAAVWRLGMFSLLVVVLYIAKYWFTRGQTYYLSRAVARMGSDLRVRLFRKLQRLPVSYFSQKRAGAIQSVLTNDVNVYQSAISIVRDSIDGPVKAITAFVSILVIQPQLALVAIMFVPVMGIAIQRNSRKMKKAQAAVQDDLANLGAMSTEAMLGVRVTKAFAAEEAMAQRYEGLVETTFASQMVAAKRQASLRPLVELLGAAALATVLYICGWLSFWGQLQLGQIAAMIYGLDLINQGVRSIGYVSNTRAQVEAASTRIYDEVLDVPEPPRTEEGKILPAPRGHIEFRNVTFRYPDGTEALRNVSFELQPGHSLALVGPSGAGKSTIADLVLRFYDPSEGEILFDGVDVRELRADWLRGQIGVVPQQTFLFAGTVAENIRLGAPEASEADVSEAARAAHAEEFVVNLPARYDSQVGETGNRLSGGQRQRVAIARALVRRPTLLLLDEATSALDPESERAVTEALDEVMRERTTLFIAPRLTTAARADRILVLSRGEVVEQGSHSELLAANGAYAGLFRAFSGGVLG
ncbi:MAG: ABC transporter ATP-binding protein [Fimbriimonas sp.]